jgi:hypothetical protein
VLGAFLCDIMDSLSDERLAAEVTRTEPGWPGPKASLSKERLRIVLDEE